MAAEEEDAFREFASLACKARFSFWASDRDAERDSASAWALDMSVSFSKRWVWRVRDSRASERWVESSFLREDIRSLAAV